jgi:hypothetical protein
VRAMVCRIWALLAALLILDVCSAAVERQSQNTPEQHRLLRASKRPNRMPLKVFAASFVSKADEDVSHVISCVVTREDSANLFTCCNVPVAVCVILQ